MTLRVSLTDTHRALTRPAHNAHLRWPERRACIITLESDDGWRGRGEAAPLPGFSPDTLAACRAALEALDPAGIPANLAPGREVLAELERVSAALPSALPAARCALEAALLELWSSALGLPAWALLSAAPPEARAVTALLQGEPEHALDAAERAHERGLRCFKLKVGRAGALERELAALAGIRGAWGDRVDVRLDANQSFSGAQARAALPRFAAYAPEFIEEPCPPAQLATLGELALPLALDESLALSEPNALPSRPLRALILKPTLLGGISGCARWAVEARRIGAELVLSHAFEGPLGLSLSAALALAFGSRTLAHGLDADGAQLTAVELPALRGAQITPWSEPGWGVPGPG